MSRQLPLALGLAPRTTLDDFVQDGNEAALAALERLLDGRLSQLYLAGPEASGKSHLLMGAVARHQERGRMAYYLPLSEIVEAGTALLDALPDGCLLALDELDRTVGDTAWERALFRLFNRTLESGGTLLFAARALPSGLGLRLPDLASRLAWGESYRLRPLDDSGRLRLLQLQARQRGLELGEAAAAWMVSRLSRDPRRLIEAVEKLDRAALADGRRLTLPFVRRHLVEK